jgi:hypothetical protein
MTPKPNLKLDSSEKPLKKAQTVQTSMDIVKEKKSPTISKESKLLKSKETNGSTLTIMKELKQVKSQGINGSTPEKGNLKVTPSTPKIATKVKTPKSSRAEKGKKVVEEASTVTVAKTPKKMAADAKSPKSMKGEKSGKEVKEALKPKTPEKILLEAKTPKSVKAEKSNKLPKESTSATPGNKKSKPIEALVIPTPEVKQEMAGPIFPEASGQDEKMEVATSGHVKIQKKTTGTNSLEGKTGTPKPRPQTTNDDSPKSGKFSAELLNELKRKLTEASGGNVLSSTTPGKKPDSNLNKRLSLPAASMIQSMKNPAEASKTPKDIKRKIEKKNLDESITNTSTSSSVESAKTPKQAKTDKSLTEISQVVKTPKEATSMKPGKSPFTTPNAQKMRRRDSKSD